MAITDRDGNTFHEGHPDCDKVRISNLQDQVRELQTAIIDLQNRMSRVDSEDLQWPADTYEPAHTQPYTG